MKSASKAVDEVRREESKHHKELLKNTRYMWPKRPQKLTDRQRPFDQLSRHRIQLARILAHWPDMLRASLAR